MQTVQPQPVGWIDALELDPRFTFESLVIGTANRLAAAAARRVAENPGRVYNPLFIYSGSGLGKTHLMTAMGHYAQRLNPGLRVVYGTLEYFLQSMTDAVEQGEREAFLRGIRGTGILLLDDVQFLAGQRGIQDELIRAWDALSGRGGQIVLASDRPPAEIDQLGERLISRFSGGLVLDIGAPDFETRVAIARQKAAELGRSLGAGVAEALARFAFGSVRELQGALNRVLAVQDLEERLVAADEVPPILGAGRRSAASDEPTGSGEAGPGPAGRPVDRGAAKPQHDPLDEAIAAWTRAGYRTTRLERVRQLGEASGQAGPLIAQFAADVERLAAIAAAIAQLEPRAAELSRTEILLDPDRLADAELMLERVRERTRPLPAPPEDITFDNLGLPPELLAVRAARAAADRGGKGYNPLYVCGPRNSGKSRLLAALGNQLLAGSTGRPLAFINGADFAAELVDALQHDRASSWRTRYHAARVLLVDDVDALAGTERAQQELFQLFDVVERAGGVLAFTAEQLPQSLDGIEDRLRTRLASGLVIELPAAAHVPAPPASSGTGEDSSRRVGREPQADAVRPAPAGPTAAAAHSDTVRDPWFLSADNVTWDLVDPLDYVVQELD